MMMNTKEINIDYRNVIINDRGFTNKSPQISYGICPTLRAEAHGNLPKVIEESHENF